MLKEEDLKPILDRNISLENFEAYYWLKSELIKFCKLNNLKVSGNKETLNQRISEFLNSDKKKLITKKNVKIKSRNKNPLISTEQKIGCGFIFGQESREFFKKHCDSKFSFNVEFMKWVKNNPDKTLDQAIQEWKLIKERKKDHSYKSTIGTQFEYNQYIRDFFKYTRKNNLTLSKKECIKCWNFKKNTPNYSRKKILFESKDLKILENIL